MIINRRDVIRDHVNQWFNAVGKLLQQYNDFDFVDGISRSIFQIENLLKRSFSSVELEYIARSECEFIATKSFSSHGNFDLRFVAILATGDYLDLVSDNGPRGRFIEYGDFQTRCTICACALSLKILRPLMEREDLWVKKWLAEKGTSQPQPLSCAVLAMIAEFEVSYE
jgi:hypothetical protein